MPQKNERKRINSGEIIRTISNLLVKLVAINFFTFLFSIPIITGGAAITAMHDCLLRVVRKDDEPVFQRFYKSFRENFKQSTLLWLPFLLIFGGVLADVVILTLAPNMLPDWIVVPAVSAGIIALMIFQYVMPLQSHFSNTPLNILRFAAILAVSHFPKTVLMTVSAAAPVLLFVFFTPSFPLVVMLGISLPGYISAKLYDPVFTVLEENENGI